jgi:hypothetical protein
MPGEAPMIAKDYFDGECFTMAERPTYMMAGRKAAEFFKNRVIAFDFFTRRHAGTLLRCRVC